MRLRTDRLSKEATSGVEQWLQQLGQPRGRGVPPKPRDEAFYVALVQTIRDSAAALPAVPVMPARTRGLSAPAQVVVYVAHPDDEVGYVGGTLAKLARNKNGVQAVMLTRGEGGRVVERAHDGSVFENRSHSRKTVARWRAKEMVAAAKGLGIQSSFLMPKEMAADFGYTTSTSETLMRWDQSLPGGLEGLLRQMVADIRRRRPDVIVTLMPEDGQAAPGHPAPPPEHGHHKAVTLLTDLAARLAADSQFPGGPPFKVRELVTVSASPPADVEISIRVEDRLQGLRAYRTQFLEEMIDAPTWKSPVEHFDVRWQARNGQTLDGTSWLEHL